MWPDMMVVYTLEARGKGGLPKWMSRFWRRHPLSNDLVCFWFRIPFDSVFRGYQREDLFNNQFSSVSFGGGLNLAVWSRRGCWVLNPDKSVQSVFSWKPIWDCRDCLILNGSAVDIDQYGV